MTDARCPGCNHLRSSHWSHGCAADGDGRVRPIACSCSAERCAGLLDRGAPSVGAPPHPDPDTMAEEDSGDDVRRGAFAAGVAAERARVAAWLREQWTTGEDGARSRNVGQRLADELEGKAQP